MAAMQQASREGGGEVKVFVGIRSISPRYHLTRAQLRELAKAHNVPRGRNTSDTVANLEKAGIKF